MAGFLQTTRGAQQRLIVVSGTLSRGDLLTRSRHIDCHSRPFCTLPIRWSRQTLLAFFDVLPRTAHSQVCMYLACYWYYWWCAVLRSYKKSSSVPVVRSSSSLCAIIFSISLKHYSKLCADSSGAEQLIAAQ